MRLLTFPRGGTHPSERKLTAASPIAVVEPKEKELFVVPLNQHFGAPAELRVKMRERVLVGQLLGEAPQLFSANVHSPVSGVVKRIEERWNPLGFKSLAVVIESDGKDERVETILEKPDESALELPREKLLERIKECGIVGMGGAMFPTHVKLSPPPDYPVDTLIINGAECEPYLTADHRLMVERAEGIVKGIAILERILGVKEVYIGIEENKRDAAGRIERAVKSASLPYEVVLLKTKYPQGAEKQLIKAITGREVFSGGLPFHVGCVVQNVGTAFAVYEAVYYRKPLYERVMTLSGGGCANPGNYLVRVGTLFSSFAKEKEEEPPVLAVAGGPMMGKAIPHLDIPVIKGTSGLLLLTAKEAHIAGEEPCIKCGRCVEHCPMGLVPSKLAKAASKRAVEVLKKLSVMDCVECGTCAYVCPASRKLVHWIRLGKSLVKKKK